MSESHGPSLWQALMALLGLAQAGFVLVCGWLWQRLGGAEKRTDEQFRDVWSAITNDRNAATASRERMLERLADMPTKADLAGLETRIAAMLAHHHRTGGDN